MKSWLRLGKPVTKAGATKSAGITLTKSYNMCITVQDSPQPTHAAIGDSNIPWPHELPPHDGLSGVSDRPGHMNSSSTDRLSWVPPSGHMNYQSGLLSEKSGIHCELRTTEVGGPKPVSNARVDKSGITLGLPLPTTDILLTGKDGSSVLKFDTQAEHTILFDPRFFPDGVDDTHRLELSTIIPGPGAKARTQGCGTAYIKREDGTILGIKDAHLYEAGLHNVVATRCLKSATLDMVWNGMRMAADQCLLPFDAGYCAMHVWPVKAETSGKSSSTPRHPDAAAAILAHSSTLLSTGYFGGITKGPKGDAGLHSMPIEDLGLLYHKRTNLSSRTLKALSDTTDAPKRLNGVPSSPVHDEATLRANFP